VPKEWYNDKEMWALFIATNDEKVIDMLARENQDIKKAVESLHPLALRLCSSLL